MSKLETTRNNRDGSITVKSADFSIVIREDGRVTTSGHVTIEEPVERFVADAGVYANPDAASPRSQPSAKKRGSK